MPNIASISVNHFTYGASLLPIQIISSKDSRELSMLPIFAIQTVKMHDQQSNPATNFDSAQLRKAIYSSLIFERQFKGNSLSISSSE